VEMAQIQRVGNGAGHRAQGSGQRARDTESEVRFLCELGI
jgi:hypothetical protein